MSGGRCSPRRGKGGFRQDRFHPHTKGFPRSQDEPGFSCTSSSQRILNHPEGPPGRDPRRRPRCPEPHRGWKPGLQAPGLAPPLAALLVWGATGVWSWGLSAADLAAPHPAYHCTALSSSVGAEAGGSFPTLQPDSAGLPPARPPDPTPARAPDYLWGGRGWEPKGEKTRRSQVSLADRSPSLRQVAEVWGWPWLWEVWRGA